MKLTKFIAIDTQIKIMADWVILLDFQRAFLIATFSYYIQTY